MTTALVTKPSVVMSRANPLHILRTPKVIAPAPAVRTSAPSEHPQKWSLFLDIYRTALVRLNANLAFLSTIAASKIMYTTSKILTISALAASSFSYTMPDGQTGKLPTLGWNSWNAYNCNITEEKFLNAAQALIYHGLGDAGYTYVNIDDCWSLKDGRVDGQMIPNTTRFPCGIKGLADTVHSMNLSLGLYSTAGNNTCACYPASLGYEDVDAEDFASWSIDYLKYDNCNIPDELQDQWLACRPDDACINTTTNGTCINKDLAPPGYDWHTSNTYRRFRQMRDALARQSRQILLSLCVWGTADVYSWGNELGVNFRFTGDIEPTWNSIMSITNINSFHLHSVDFWAHNDADMLEVGNGDLTAAETRTHFALWAIMKSPLLIGTDLTTLSRTNVDLLKNPYLLAFNQDNVYSQPAMPYKWGTNPDWTFNETWPAEYWSGKSQAGTIVMMVNPSNDTTQVMKVVWDEVPGLGGPGYKVMDVWTGEDVEGCIGAYWKYVEPHDSSVLLVKEAC